MNKYRRIVCLTVVLLLTLTSTFCLAEKNPNESEQGLDELQPLLEMTQVDEKEGMSLEEITDAFAESAMSEYFDGESGFSMQYPSVFQSDEEQVGTLLITQDGKASLSIDNMNNTEGRLDAETLKNAIRLEAPDVEIHQNEQNGCLRTDRITDDGKTGQTDLYLLTEHSLHHIVIRYPAAEQGTYFIYIEYMINTMETNETDLG